MEIIEYKNAPKIPIEFEAHNLCNRKDLDIIHLIIKEGTVLDRHKNPTDVIFYIINGKGIFEAGDNRYVITEKTCIQIEANLEHGWINSGQGDLVLLVIQIKKT
jgi:quercetin dioxygenase-like cupin family protein